MVLFLLQRNWRIAGDSINQVCHGASSTITGRQRYLSFSLVVASDFGDMFDAEPAFHHQEQSLDPSLETAQ
jgi:hypothetical protein